MWRNDNISNEEYMEDVKDYITAELGDCVEMLPYIFATNKFDKKNLKKMKKDVKEMYDTLSSGNLYDLCK